MRKITIALAGLVLASGQGCFLSPLPFPADVGYDPYANSWNAGGDAGGYGSYTAADPCESLGYYGDGVCDMNCLYLDQDCFGGGYGDDGGYADDGAYGDDGYGDGGYGDDGGYDNDDGGDSDYDWCAAYGYYGDGYCDLDCPQYDSDCEAYDSGDGSGDWCEAYGYYGDGYCDWDCPYADPDCG